MDLDSPLKGKTLLIVDDEPDVLETLADLLDMAIIHQARDYGTAVNYLNKNSYDAVVLDIMGVNGFELLKTSVQRGYPTVMLTA